MIKQEGSTQKQNQHSRWIEITWSKHDEETLVNGVCIPFIRQLKKIDEKAKGLKTAQINNNFLCSFSTIGKFNQVETKQALMKVTDSAKSIFVMMIRENGGGQSYHQFQSILVSESKHLLIDNAGDYFDNEHRQEDCIVLNQGECDCQMTKMKFLESLETCNYSDCNLVSGKVQEATFCIYQINIL